MAGAQYPMLIFLSDNKATVTDWNLFLWFGHFGLAQHVQRLIYLTFSTLPFLPFFLISSKSLFWRNFRSEAKENSAQFALLPTELPMTEGFHSLLSHINSAVH
jgi:hypothetical protein